MNVVILTEGLKGTGYGHLTRCLSLYQAFEERGIRPKFIADCDEIGQVFLGQIHLHVQAWRDNFDDFIRIAGKSDILVVDSYLAGPHVYKRLNATTDLLACFDDYQRIDYPAGVVINGTIGAERIPYPGDGLHRYLLGIQYMPLRREFWDVSPRKLVRESGNVLLIFGGQDTRNMTDGVLKHLLTTFPEFTYHVVSSANPDRAHSAPDSRRVKHHANLTAGDFLLLMQGCDFAVSAAGITTYELARIGLPTIAVGVVDNQRANLRGWTDAGFLRSELWWDDPDLFQKIDIEVMTHLKSTGGPGLLCDGQGARRVARQLCEWHEANT